MEYVTILLFFTFGVLLIIKGGDWFIDSAVGIARLTKLPDVLIGATIVSVATTLPELLVSTIATHREYYDVAIGNVVGSLVCNIGLILGIAAIISPIKTKSAGFAIKGYFMILCGGVLLYLFRDTIITPGEGNILLLLFLIYIAMNILEFKSSEKDKSNQNNKPSIYNMGIVGIIVRFTAGAVLIIVGARLLVDNGVILADAIGVPDQIIGVTLIALGTSLPELITAISAILKGHGEISAGNILGANILNMVMALGICSKIGKQGLVISYQNIMLGATIHNVPQTLYLDMPVALLLMSIVVVSGSIKGVINRKIGLTILSIYMLYIIILGKLFI